MFKTAEQDNILKSAEDRCPEQWNYPWVTHSSGGMLHSEYPQTKMQEFDTNNLCKREEFAKLNTLKFTGNKLKGHTRNYSFKDIFPSEQI